MMTARLPRLLLAAVLAGLVGLVGLLGGCARPSARPPADAAASSRQPLARTTAADGTPIITSGGVEIEKMPFRAGVSSATVERLAKQQGCEGGLGASLVSDPGPVEVYRMACSNGKVFLARCELRQCKPGVRSDITTRTGQ